MFNKRIIVLLLLLLTTAYTDTLTINVSENPPMVMNTEDGLQGYSIDLWTQIAQANGWEFEFNLVDSFPQMFTDLQNGNADASMSGITITSAREEIVDFSHSYHSTGLSAVVKKDRFEIWSLVKSNLSFYSNLILKLFPFIISWFLYVWLWAVVLWKLEQGNEMFADQFHKGWRDAKFFVHVVISSTGFGNQIPMSKWGRLITIVLMYSGIGFMFPMITGKISSEMTRKAPYTYIQQVEDLRGRSVVVLRGRTSSNFAEKYECDITVVETLREAILHVKAGEVDAFIYDRPALHHIVGQESDLSLLEDNFNVENYGIVLPENSTLRDDINIFLIQAQENGLLEGLRNKWLPERGVNDN